MLARRGYRRNATRAAPAETRRRNGADQVFSRLSHPVSHRATSAGGRKPLRHFRLGFIDVDKTPIRKPAMDISPPMVSATRRPGTSASSPPRPEPG